MGHNDSGSRFVQTKVPVVATRKLDIYLMVQGRQYLILVGPIVLLLTAEQPYFYRKTGTHGAKL